jgi:hypothetical protein
MAYIDDFNSDPNNPRFINKEQLIEYIFLGFDLPLTIDQKLSFIKKFGRPRARPLKVPKIETDEVVVTLPEPSFETQLIYKSPPAEAKAKDHP